MAKKRIAVIGCSHSSYEQTVNSKDNKDWVHILADKYPNIQFDNYANIGRGPLYYDFVLKHIITHYPRDYYDAVVVQFTAENRWMIGLEQLTPSTNDKNGFNTTYQPSHNYTSYTLTHPHIIATTTSVFIYEENNMYVCPENTPLVCPTHKTKYQTLRETIKLHYGKTDSIAMFYEKMFVSTLETLYKDKFNNLFYWDWMSGWMNSDEINRTNMSLDGSFIQWAINKFGEEYVVMELLDGTVHCTTEGNRVLVEEYLSNCELKFYLEDDI